MRETAIGKMAKRMMAEKPKLTFVEERIIEAGLALDDVKAIDVQIEQAGEAIAPEHREAVREVRTLLYCAGVVLRIVTGKLDGIRRGEAGAEDPGREFVLSDPLRRMTSRQWRERGVLLAECANVLDALGGGLDGDGRAEVEEMIGRIAKALAK